MRFRHLPGRLALPWACLLASACVGSPLSPSQLDGWHSVEVGGARLTSDVPVELLATMAADLVAFDAALAHLVGRRLPPAAAPVRILVLRDPAIQRLFGLSPGSGVAGWALTTLDGAHACVGATRRVSARMTLLHEYTHLVLTRERNALLPLWYNEGLAEYFSTVSLRDGALVVGVPPGRLLARLEARGPLPLARLFSEELDPRDGQSLADFYATSWAFVHWALGRPAGRRELSRFESQLALGADLDSARRAAFGRGFEALDAELATHIAFLQRGAPAETLIDASAIAIDAAAAPIPLPRPAVSRRLGGLALALAGALFESGEADGEVARLARRLLETADAKGPADPLARADLALARALAGDAEGARRELAEAMDVAAPGAGLWLRAAQVYRASGDARAARQYFERAIELGADSASAWYGLGVVLADEGQSEPARQALERARQEAWSAPLDLALGRLNLVAGRSDEALALLLPLARDPHGGSAAERAEELLREAGLLRDRAVGDREGRSQSEK